MAINNKDHPNMSPHFSVHFTVRRSVTFSLAVLPAAMAAMFATSAAFAQAKPDAGQLLQQDRVEPQLPQAAPALTVQPPVLTPVLPGGATVSIQGVRFEGATVFTDEQLLAVLGGVVGKSFDMAGLQGLAQRLSEYYRASGYPFARAFLPEQKFANGVLTLLVLEGR